MIHKHPRTNMKYQLGALGRVFRRRRMRMKLSGGQLKGWWCQSPEIMFYIFRYAFCFPYYFVFWPTLFKRFLNTKFLRFKTTWTFKRWESNRFSSSHFTGAVASTMTISRAAWRLCSSRMRWKSSRCTGRFWGGRRNRAATSFPVERGHLLVDTLKVFATRRDEPGQWSDRDAHVKHYLFIE